MRPKINLYDPEVFPVSHDWLDAHKAFWISVGFFSLLLLGSGWVLVEKFLIDREMGLLEGQKGRLVAVLEDFENNRNFDGPDPEQVRQQTQLERDIRVKKLVLELLSGRRVGNREGFSSHFTELARKRFSQLWLTQIRFLNGGRDIVIVGRTLSGQEVFDFLQFMTKGGAFSGREFEYFQMQKIPVIPGMQRQMIRFAFGNDLETMMKVWQADLTPQERDGDRGGGPDVIDLKLDAAKGQPNPLALIKEMIGIGGGEGP